MNLEIGAHEGLNEVITVPYFHLGSRMGSCTFAGTTQPEQAHRFIGAAQLVGIFSFQAALTLCSGGRPLTAAPPSLHPRPRDCVVLAGRGYSTKQIPQALALTQRTADG